MIKVDEKKLEAGLQKSYLEGFKDGYKAALNQAIDITKEIMQEEIDRNKGKE